MQNFLKQFGINALDWPKKFSRPNPIENLWAIVNLVGSTPDLPCGICKREDNYVWRCWQQIHDLANQFWCDGLRNTCKFCKYSKSGWNWKIISKWKMWCCYTTNTYLAACGKWVILLRYIWTAVTVHQVLVLCGEQGQKYAGYYLKCNNACMLTRVVFCLWCKCAFLAIHVVCQSKKHRFKFWRELNSFCCIVSWC